MDAQDQKLILISPDDAQAKQVRQTLSEQLRVASENILITRYDEAIQQLIENNFTAVVYANSSLSPAAMGEIENISFMFPHQVVMVIVDTHDDKQVAQLFQHGVQLVLNTQNLAQQDVNNLLQHASWRQQFIANCQSVSEEDYAAYFLITPTGQIENLNAAMASLLEVNASEVRGHNIKEFVFFPHFFRSGVIINANFSEDPYNYHHADEQVIDLRISEGKPLTVNYRQRILRNTQNKVLFNVLSMKPGITNPLADDETQKQAGIGRQAYMAEPAFFYKSILRSCERADRTGDKLAIVHVKVEDLWRAKKYFGKDVFQKFLNTLSSRLHALLRSTDLLSYQDGGFTLLLESLDDVYGASKAVEKLLKVFREPLLLRDNKIFVTANIGIVIYPFSNTLKDQLIVDAKKASELAAKKGSNNFLFHQEELNDENRRRVLISRDLKYAIERNELFLVFQPIYNIKSKTMTDFEVLLRWNHPVQGSISPQEFIPIAEELGLIIPIGEWILKMACRQYSQWLEAGLLDESVAMSINVSTRELLHVSYVDYLEKLVSRYNLPASSIELEIPEISALRHTNMLLLNLNKLKKLGVKIAIDDFGMSSAVDYLRNMTITTLKIDSSHIENLDSDPVNMFATESILRLAKELNVSVVAKGVERQRQLEALEDRDCLSVQGYLLSKPLTASAFSSLLKLQSLKYHGS